MSKKVKLCAKHKLNGNILNIRAMERQQCVCSVLLRFICRLEQSNKYLKIAVETEQFCLLIVALYVGCCQNCEST